MVSAASSRPHRNLEGTIHGLGLLAGFPSSVILLYLIWTQAFSFEVRWTVVAIVVVTWLSSAAVARQLVTRTLLLAACSGGIITSMLLGHLAARGGQDRIAGLGPYGSLGGAHDASLRRKAHIDLACQLACNHMRGYLANGAGKTRFAGATKNRRFAHAIEVSLASLHTSGLPLAIAMPAACLANSRLRASTPWASSLAQP